MNRMGVGPPELFGARPLILSELRKYLQSSPPTRPAGDLNRMESEWDQLQSDTSIALQWGSIFSSFVPLHIIHAYSISGIFPGYEILPKLNWSKRCFQDLPEVSQKYSHILAPDNLVQSSSRPNIINVKLIIALMTNFYFYRLVVSTRSSSLNCA